MKDKPETPQAFPVQTHEEDGQGKYINYQENGLSKLEYFVGQILSGDIGVLANTADPIICAKVAINLAEKVLSVLAERSKSNE